MLDSSITVCYITRNNGGTNMNIAGKTVYLLYHGNDGDSGRLMDIYATIWDACDAIRDKWWYMKPHPDPEERARGMWCGLDTSEDGGRTRWARIDERIIQGDKED
jgi:hypothetical protein